MDNTNQLAELAAEIVSAYVGNNPVPRGELPKLIGEVYHALAATVGGGNPKDAPQDPQPAVNVRKSITPDHLICLEDGKKFKSLKRHLRTHYNLSPEQYRDKWNLPASYPMVASKYAEARSKLAKRMGLGQRRKSV
ncbi:MAG: MucR family transcriptional regulator [Aestuariivirga sp.]